MNNERVIREKNSFYIVSKIMDIKCKSGYRPFVKVTMHYTFDHYDITLTTTACSNIKLHIYKFDSSRKQTNNNFWIHEPQIFLFSYTNAYNDSKVVEPLEARLTHIEMLRV